MPERIPIQQYGASAKLPTSVFTMTATGSNWTLSPASSSGQCLDAGAGTNGTGIVMAACNGSAQQAWSISPDVQSGNFFVKVTSTNRCMTVRGGNTAAGAVMEIDDCTSSSSQKFAIQATVVGSDTSNQTSTGGSTGGTTGTGGSGGSTATFSSSRTYRMVPRHATGESIDVSNNSQNNGTAVQQYGSWGTTSQAFYLLQSGSDWKITMSANQNKCIGPSNNGTGNSTLIVIQDCNGSTAQSYTAMPMSTSGVYAFKNVGLRALPEHSGRQHGERRAPAAVGLRHHPRHQRPVQRAVSADLVGAPGPTLHRTTAGPPPRTGRFLLGRLAAQRVVFTEQLLLLCRGQRMGLFHPRKIPSPRHIWQK